MLPDGKYLVKHEQAIARRIRGIDYMYNIFQVLEGPYSGRAIFDRIVTRHPRDKRAVAIGIARTQGIRDRKAADGTLIIRVNNCRVDAFCDHSGVCETANY